MEVTRGEAIRSFLWKFFERSSVQVVQFVITIILARILLPSEYGIIALIMVFISISQVIVDGGFNTALIQKKQTDNVDFSTIFYFGLFMALIMYGVLYFTAPFIASYYKQPDLIPVIRVMACVLFFQSIVAVQNAYVARNLLFRKLFICSLVSVLLSGIVGVFMAYHGYGVWALVAQMLVSQGTLAIIMWIVLGWRPQLVFSKERLKTLLDYGWKILTANFIVSVFVNIRKLIIGRFYSPASLAYFDRGEQIPNIIMTNIQTSVQTVMFPIFAKEQDNRIRVKQMLRRTIKMNCFIIHPLMILLIVVAKPLVLLLLTEKWLPAVPFLQIFCVANLFRPITFPNFEAIKALGYSNIALRLEIIKKIVDVALLVTAVFLGIYAIAWSIVAYDFICVFINLQPCKKLLDYSIPEQVRDTIPTLLFSLLAGAIVYWIQLINMPLLLILLLQFFTGAGLYILLCFLFKEESYRYVLDIIKGRIINR